MGNAALDGAAIVALDPGVLELAVGAAASARHVDLALDAGFARGAHGGHGVRAVLDRERRYPRR